MTLLNNGNEWVLSHYHQESPVYKEVYAVFQAVLQRYESSNGVTLGNVKHVLPLFLFPQGGACKNARQTQRPWGHARRDGAHPHRHPGRRPVSPCAVETETYKVVQCKKQKSHNQNALSCDGKVGKCPHVKTHTWKTFFCSGNRHSLAVSGVMFVYDPGRARRTCTDSVVPQTAALSLRCMIRDCIFTYFLS